MSSLDGRPFDVDVAVQVPHGALRLHVMGERGARREVATGEDIAAMARIAREAIEAGALGFTTSRTLNHRTSQGELTPTLTAEADELVGIARAIGATGKGVLQVVSDFTDVDAEFAIFRRMAEESGRPVSFSLVQVRGDAYRRQLELLTEANAAGVQMTGQVAPRPVGIMLGLECTLHPLLAQRCVPRDQRAPARRARRGHVGSGRSKRECSPPTGRSTKATTPVGASSRRSIGCSSSAIRPTTSPTPATASRPGRAVKAATPLDLAYDLLLRDGGRSFLYLPFLNYADGNLDAVGEMLAHPNTVIGLGDGGAHVGTICDASFPTTLLTLWVRDRDHGRLDLPFAVQRHTSATAAHRRPARPRRARARVPRRRERDRLRAPHCPPAGDASRPPGRR